MYMPPKNMLIVDDDQLLGWALGRELPGENLSVTVVETGKDALHEIGKNSYHLILLGIHLPDINGLELLGEIRKINTDSRIFITSADVSESNKEKAFSGGASQFLEKPFSISDLQGLLRSAFGEYSMKRRHDRYICNLPVHVELPGNPPEDASYKSGHHRGNILDVGKAGIRLSIDQPLAVGQELRLAHALEDSTFAKFIPPGVRAEVVWVAPDSDGWTAGLRFAN